MGGFAIGARVALLWQHNANPSYKVSWIPRYDDIVRTAGWAGSARAAGRRPAGDGGRPQNRAPHTASGRGRPAGDRPPTGGVLNILRQSGLRAYTGGVLATKSERKMLITVEYMKPTSGLFVNIATVLTVSRMSVHSGIVNDINPLN